MPEQINPPCINCGRASRSHPLINAALNLTEAYLAFCEASKHHEEALWREVQTGDGSLYQKLGDARDAYAAVLHRDSAAGGMR